jgi:predicted hydrocarbon binding protein
MAEKKFTERWVKNLIESLDAHADEETKTAVMESCGRACARAGAISSAQKCQGDLDKLLAALESWIGKGNTGRDGDVVHIVYPKCFCHLVSDGPARLPDSYCLCSQGWLKEMFETVTGKAVRVELLESVKRGGDQCSFKVQL